jgi:hypothetical protein
VLEGLAAAVVPAPPAIAAPADPAQVQAFLQELQALLRVGDSGALDLLQARAGLLQAAAPQAHLAIAAAVEGFDFEAALALLPGAAPAP